MMNTYHIIDKYTRLFKELLKIAVEINAEKVTIFGDDGWHIDIKEDNNGKWIGNFDLVKMINCCGIVVLTEMKTGPLYSNKGVGTLMNQMAIELGKADGYGLIICTDIKKNPYHMKILNKNKWKEVYESYNPRTKHKIGTFVYDLNNHIF